MLIILLRISYKVYKKELQERHLLKVFKNYKYIGHKKLWLCLRLLDQASLDIYLEFKTEQYYSKLNDFYDDVKDEFFSDSKENVFVVLISKYIKNNYSLE